MFDSSGALYQWTSYEPFGKTIPGSPETDRLSWIGKEKDKESDLGDFGVRKYDNETGRFLSVDPLWEKYSKLSLYQYSNNNPINLVDPTGLEVETSEMSIDWGDDAVNEMQTADREAWLKDLVSITGITTLRIENDKLTYDANGSIVSEGTSQTARDHLKGLINDKENTLSVRWRPTEESRTKDNNVTLSSQQINGFIGGTSSGLDKRTLGWGMVFLHESKHSTMGGGANDDKSSFGATGPVVDFENKIRTELGPGWGQRKSYIALEGYIPFSASTLNHMKSSSFQSGGVPIGQYVKGKTEGDK